MRKGVFNSVLEGHLEKCWLTPQAQYSAAIYVRKQRYDVLAVKSFARESDYDSQMFESMRVLIAVPSSVRNIVMLKGYDDIEMSLVTRVNGRVISDKTYHGVTQNISNNEMEAISKDMVNRERQDLTDIGWVVVELYDRVAWSLRKRQIGGTWRDTTPLDVARYILTKTALRDSLSDKDFVYSINYHEEEQQAFSCITIPESTNYLDAFDYLQNRYGIYSRGFGIFLSKQNWSIFRPYDAEKFAEGGKRLVIYNVPQDDMQALDRNFYTEGDVTYIAATGESKVDSKLMETALNEGTGVRFADVRSLEFKMQKAVGDGGEVRPEQYLSEVNPNTRNNGVFAPVLSERFVDSAKRLSSGLRRRQGMSVTVKWENGLYQLLEPGMGVEFYYPKGDGIAKVRGTLAGVLEHSSILSDGIMEKTHGNVIALSLLLFPYG